MRKIEIIGEWMKKDGKVIGNKNCDIIEHLIRQHMTKISDRDGGWTILYFSPTDQTYWELSYPHGHMHGGGSPKLTSLTDEEASSIYKLDIEPKL